MDAQDHKKTSPSGHEGHGLHLCHKCGWPFPNPHPSAKHRRSHKKVCGKMEGYPINDSESGRLSDDEHLSDDDLRTPSPKMDKGITKELGGSGGTGLLKSNKSEDEVFSDAVTEFSDSGFSPSMEEPLDRVGQLEKNVGKELAHDLIDSQQTKDDRTDGLTKELDDSTRGREEAVGNATNQLENSKPSSDIRFQEVSVEVDQMDGQPINSFLVASENILKNIDMNGNSEKEKELISSEPKSNAEVKESVMEVECCTGYVAPLSMSAIEGPKPESTLDDLKEKGSEHVVPDYIVPEEDGKTLDTVILEPKLNEADMNVLHSAAGGDIVEQEKEPCKLAETGNVILEPILSEADGNNSSAVGEIEQDKDQIDMLQADMTQHDLSSQIEPPKNTDSSGTTQAEADPTKDILGHGMAEDYDFKVEGGKETLLVSVSESLPVIENPKIMTQDFKDYKVLKSSFPLDLGNAEVTRPVEMDETVVSEPDPSSSSSITSSHSDVSSSDNLEKKGVLGSVGEEVNTSGLQVISEEGSGTDGSVTLHSTENQCPVGFEPDLSNEKSSQNEISSSSAMGLSDGIPARSSIDEVKTNSSIVEKAEDNVINKSYYVITESRTGNSFDKYKSFTSQKYKDEVNMEATQGLEIGSNNELSSKGVSGVVSEICPEDHSVASDKQSENSIVTEVQRPTSAIGGVPEMNPEDQNVESKKFSEDSIFKEPTPLPIASVISKQSSTAAEGIHVKDATASDPLLDEADDKLRMENLNLSAVDDSVVSSSGTESLEGNWGSVSVLSTQSDGTALTDAEALSTGALAPEKSEGTSLNPQTATVAYHSDKSDACEPPSFMTLVDSRPELDKAVAASEIKTVQKTEPSKSEAVEAGWIPSLTNVMNESEGRKKNEEIIAKVTNWSSGKQHSPLKNLLIEAHAETKVKIAATEKQFPLVTSADETASKNNGAAVTTVSSIMGSETPVHDAAKREMEKEWNSPARYPTEIKKEKKKGKPYWVPFVCCTSIHQGM